MEKILRKELREVTIYIAIDGTEFLTQKECMEYEQKVEEFILKLGKIKHFPDFDQRSGSSFDWGEHNKNYTYRWYKPKNKEEIKMLQQVYDPRPNLSDDLVNQWICVESQWSNLCSLGESWGILLIIVLDILVIALIN